MGERMNKIDRINRCCALKTDGRGKHKDRDLRSEVGDQLTEKLIGHRAKG
jgi:hypothetical protein